MHNFKKGFVSSFSFLVVVVVLLFFSFSLERRLT